MALFDREQLEALKRQIDDDYRLDMAAIERLNRRFSGASANLATATGTHGAPLDRRVTVLPTLDAQAAEPEPDELTNTLRGMFSSHRK